MAAGSRSAPPSPRGRRAGCGLLAGGLALTFLWAASRVEPAIPFAPVALAERIVRVTPGSLATFSIERLGQASIPLLAGGATTLLLAFGAGLAALPIQAPRRRAGSAGVAFAAVLALAGLSYRLPDASAAGLIAGTLAAAALYALALAWLDWLHARADRPQDASRRAALGWMLSAAGGLVAAGTLLDGLGRREVRAVTLARPDRAANLPRRAPFPAIDDLSREVTSPDGHYVVDIDIVDPAVDPAAWRLEVDGLVGRPLSLDADELQRRFAVVEQHSVLTCVSNKVGGSLVGSSIWTGVRLRDVLAAAAPSARARHVVFECADGYAVDVPLATASEPYALLALGQGRRPLRREHGAPCRACIPALYGMMSAKWIERIRLVERPQRGYWARRGWSPMGVVRTASRIDTRADVVAARPTWIAGVAWAGVRGIDRVEVSTDGGRTWTDAVLRSPASPYAWTQWAQRWTPPRPGTYTVLCRATDGEGRLQDAAQRAPHPSGATGYHRIELRAT